MFAKIVFERDDYGQGCYEQKFGFCIGSRVWWVGIEGYGHDARESAKGRELCREIVRRLNDENGTEADHEG